MSGSCRQYQRVFGPKCAARLSRIQKPLFILFLFMLLFIDLLDLLVDLYFHFLLSLSIGKCAFVLILLLSDSLLFCYSFIRDLVYSCIIDLFLFYADLYPYWCWCLYFVFVVCSGPLLWICCLAGVVYFALVASCLFMCSFLLLCFSYGFTLPVCFF